MGAATSSTPAGRVFVKRAGLPRANFASVDIFVGDAVRDLAERVALSLGASASSAAFVDLCLVDELHAAAVENGVEESGIGGRLFSGAKLADVKVLDGSYLLARVLVDPPGAGTSDSNGAGDDMEEILLLVKKLLAGQEALAAGQQELADAVAAAAQARAERDRLERAEREHLLRRVDQQRRVLPADAG